MSVTIFCKPLCARGNCSSLLSAKQSYKRGVNTSFRWLSTQSVQGNPHNVLGCEQYTNVVGCSA